MSDSIKRNSFALLAAMIWGLAFVVQKGNTTGPFTFNAMRSLIAFLFLLPVSVVLGNNGKMVLHEREKKETKKLWLGGLLCGAAIGLATVLQQYGMDSGTEAGKASFLTAMYVVFVPVLALFIKKRVPFPVWIAIGFAVVGLYFLCVRTDFTIDLCDMFVFASSVLLAVHILLIDKFTETCDGIKLSCIQFLSMGVICLLPALLLERDTFAQIGPSFLPALFLGVCSSGIACTLQVLALRGGNPTITTVLLCTESVFGVAAAALILSEVMEPREWIGCGLMLIAVLLTQLPIEKWIRNKREKPNQTENS